MAYYSKLNTSADNFSAMMNAFGVVTVMNAKVFELPQDDTFKFSEKTAEDIRNDLKDAKEGVATTLGFKLLADIDSLEIANVTVEGPNKTATGGQYSNPLIKFGKSARLEMQDALGRAKAVEAFGGSVNEYGEAEYKNVKAMHITEDFAPTRLVIGDSFFISKATGQQVKVKIIFYQVLPDSIFNLNQDSDGDATVFDMNADLLTTVIKVSVDDKKFVQHGVFYSIVPYESEAAEGQTSSDHV